MAIDEDEVERDNGEVRRLYEAGRLAEALRLGTEVLERARALPDGGMTLVESLSNLGAVHWHLGDFPAAEPLFDQALQIGRAELGDRHPDVAAALNSLALVRHEMGDYRAAEPLYREALELARAGGGDGGWMALAAALNNLADMRKEMGDVREAGSLIDEALTILRPRLGERNLTVATLQHNQGVMKQLLGELPEAEQLMRGALEVQQQQLGEEHPTVLGTLRGLAGLLARQGNFSEAERLYRRALGSTRGASEEPNDDQAQILVSLAEVKHHTGDFEAAESLLEDAAAIRERLGHGPTVGELGILAELHAATGRPGSALAELGEREDLLDATVAQVFSVASEAQRLSHLADLFKHLDQLLSLVLIHLPEDREAHGLALDVVLRRKGVGSEAMAAAREAVLGGRHPELVPRFRELARFRMQIARKTLAGSGPEGAREHRRILARWEQERDRLEAGLAREIPEMSRSDRLGTPNRRAVADALPAGTVLVEFVRFYVYDFTARADPELPGWGLWRSQRYAAFVLRAGEPDGVSMVDLGDAGRIEDAVREYRAAMTGEAGSEEGPPPASEREAGEALCRAVFDPLMRAIGDRTRLFLAPDGDLTQIPFEVLPTDRGGRLIDGHRISYLSTGRDLLRIGEPSGATPTAPLVLADPDFDLGGSASSAPGDDQDARGRRSADLDRAALHFDRLPETELEGRDVAGLFGRDPLTGASVLETRLKAVASPLILHIATHGFFLPDQGWHSAATLGSAILGDAGPLRGPGMESPLLRSGLAVAGVNTFLTRGSLPLEAEDGLLTAEDVSGLDLLATEMVVLSACETGLGEVRVGEGVFGLRRAFVLAGARTLVMSLWKVPDHATRLLMKAFYGHLKEGLPRAEALRQAQLDVAETYPPPRFWGAFICQGDPGPLAFTPNSSVAGSAARTTAGRHHPRARQDRPVSAKLPRRIAPPQVPMAPPIQPEPTPVVSGSLADVLRRTQLNIQEVGPGRFLLSFRGEVSDRFTIRAREMATGVVMFGAEIPEVPRRGTKKLLRHALRSTASVHYIKAMFMPTGERILAVELPLEVLAFDVAEAVVRSLAALVDRVIPDPTDEARWRDGVVEGVGLLRELLRVDERTKAAVPDMLTSAGATVERLADDTFRANLGYLEASPGVFYGVPEIRVRTDDVAITLVNEPRLRPRGNEQRYLTRLLEFNRLADVAKVVLDEDGDVALVYEVPRLSPALVRHAGEQVSRLWASAVQMHSGGEEGSD